MPMPMPEQQPSPVPPLVQPPPPDPQVKPTEILNGPRVEVVSPAMLRPGNSYTLDLQGKNFSSDTTISFGKNIRIVGIPTISSPTEASVVVIVSNAAPPGVVPALAESPSSGANTGPGGVIIGVASTRPEIILDLPRDSRVPMTLGARMLFSWHESHPGAASFFVYELIDEDSVVIFSAQTTKPLFRFSAADLSVLPLSEVPRAGRWRVRGRTNKAEAKEVESSDERAIRLPPRR